MKNGSHCPLTYSPYNPTIHPFTQQYMLTLTYKAKKQEKESFKNESKHSGSCLQLSFFVFVFLLVCFLFCFFETEFLCVAMVELTL